MDFLGKIKICTVGINIYYSSSIVNKKTLTLIISSKGRVCYNTKGVTYNNKILLSV